MSIFSQGVGVKFTFFHIKDTNLQSYVPNTINVGQDIQLAHAIS